MDTADRQMRSIDTNCRLMVTVDRFCKQMNSLAEWIMLQSTRREIRPWWNLHLHKKDMCQCLDFRHNFLYLCNISWKQCPKNGDIFSRKHENESFRFNVTLGNAVCVEVYLTVSPLTGVYCLLPTSQCRLPIPHCPLLTVHCPLPTTHCFTAHCPLSAVPCLLSLPTACPLFIVHCPLPAINSPLPRLLSNVIAQCPLPSVLSPLPIATAQVPCCLSAASLFLLDFKKAAACQKLCRFVPNGHRFRALGWQAVDVKQCAKGSRQCSVGNKPVGRGHSAVNCGQRAADSNQWSVSSKQWAVGCK